MSESKGILILGAGSAGLLVAKHLAEDLIARGLDPQAVCVMGKGGGGSSVLSSWYVAQYEPEAFERRLISGLGDTPSPAQLKLVRYIARNHIKATEEFARDVMQHTDTGGLKRFTDGFSQIRALTGYSSVKPLPGKRILDFLKRQVAGYGVRLRTATITGLAQTSSGFRVNGRVRGDETLVEECAKLVIATGGMAHVHEFATSARGEYPNVVELAHEQLGVEVEDLNRAVFFPFAIHHEGFRAGSILPPSFMTKAAILLQTPDGQLLDFLSDELKAAVRSGDYRPQFPELIRLFNEAIAQGNRVVAQTSMTPQAFEDYCQNDHYGYVFHGKTYEDARLIGIAPAYHSALGGILVDDACRSSNPDVFAVGESAMVFGNDRPIGGEHVSAITLAPLVAGILAEEAAQAGIARAERRPSAAVTDLLELRSAIDELDWSIVEAILNARKKGNAEQRRDLGDGGPYFELLLKGLWARCDIDSLRTALGQVDESSYTRIRDTDFPPSLDQVVAERGTVLSFLESLPGAAYDRLNTLLTDRLLVVSRVAPLKLEKSNDIRDSAREEEVIQRVANVPSQTEDRALVAGIYRYVVLPCAFEVQHLYRSSLPRA